MNENDRKRWIIVGFLFAIFALLVLLPYFGVSIPLSVEVRQAIGIIILVLSLFGVLRRVAGK